MIVVDSSVWIAHLRDLLSGPVRMLRGLRSARQILVGDLVLAEILQGARDDRHGAMVEAEMRRFQVAQMVDGRIAVQAARNYRLLRQRGHTVRGTVDLLVGTFCIENGHFLLQQDRDFAPMAAHLGLQIVVAE